MGSLEFAVSILLFSVIHQIFCDHPLSGTTADESHVLPEFRTKRSHALKSNLEKRDVPTRANMLAAAKNQTPKTRLMNLCIGEPVTRRRAVFPRIQNKATATAQPKNVATATIVQPEDIVTGTIVHPKMETMIQKKPVATATIIQPYVQPQINSTVSVEQSTSGPTVSILQPNMVATNSASEIQPKSTATVTTRQRTKETVCVNPIITELANCTTIHQENSTTSETHHVFHEIHGNSNDSLETKHHYIVDIPIDHDPNNTNTIHHVIVNHTHSVNSKNTNVHDNDAFYEENSNGAKIFHTITKDTSHNTRKANTDLFPTISSTVTGVTVQNSTDGHNVSSSKDISEAKVFEMVPTRPNVKQESVKTLSDVLKQVNVQLIHTPKPLISGNIDGIKVVENKIEEHNLDQIKIEPDDDIVIDKFDVEEVKESYKNPTDYSNDISTVSSGWGIHPSVDNQDIQGTNGAIISYDDYVNYFKNGGYKANSNDVYSYGKYKGNSKAAYSYPYNNYCVTKAPKAKKLSEAERSFIKDRIWRKWINTQIYIRRPGHENASPKVDEHVKSTSWSQEQKIPVIGYNGYYTNQNSSSCS